MECRERTSGEQQAHLAAIRKIVERWYSGEITTAAKRELIGRENAFYHGQVTRGRTGTVITAATAEHARLPSRTDEDREHWWQETA